MQHHQLKTLRRRMQRTSVPSRAVCNVSKKLKRLPGKQSSEQTSVSRLPRLPETKQKGLRTLWLQSELCKQSIRSTRRRLRLSGMSRSASRRRRSQRRKPRSRRTSQSDARLEAATGTMTFGDEKTKRSRKMAPNDVQIEGVTKAITQASTKSI